jgi:hypothetical protein
MTWRAISVSPYSEEGDLTSDLWLLDFDTMQWSMVSTYGQAAPCPRRGHAMCGSEENRKIIVCGGFDGDTHLMVRRCSFTPPLFCSPLLTVPGFSV